MNPRHFNLLGGNEGYYPRALEEKFPRVFNKLVELWETSQADPYLQDLMMNTRDGTRKGFPSDVATEIFRLSTYYNNLHHPKETVDVWASDRNVVHKEVEKPKVKFVSKSFLDIVEEGDLETIARMISEGADIHVRDERNWCALMVAAAAGKDEVLSLLLKSGAQFGVRDFQGFSALHWAAFNGHSKIVKILLALGDEPNAKSLHGFTPLIQAASKGHFLVCALLIEQGAEVNASTDEGWTALHKASLNGHAQIVKLLLDRGANKNTHHRDGSTPVDSAVKVGNPAIIALLKMA